MFVQRMLPIQKIVMLLVPKMKYTAVMVVPCPGWRMVNVTMPVEQVPVVTTTVIVVRRRME